MKKGEELFARYAQERAQSQMLDVHSGKPDVALFRDSLESAVAHTTLATTPTDRSGAPFALRAGFLDRMTPNARAEFWRGANFMAMHTALFVAINEFAMFCFTQARFFPDLGDPSLENSPLPLDDRAPGLWLLDFTTQGGHVEPHHGEAITPRSQGRYNLAIYLALLMARFTWLHEFSHCFGGHARFVQETGRALYLNEVAEPISIVGFAQYPAPSANIRRDKVLRCLEIDADQSAFWACCQIQLRDRENIEGIADLDRSTRFRLALFACYAMTWLFEEFQAYLDARRGRSHPAPYLRLHNMLRIAASNIAPAVEGFAAINRDVCAQFDAIRAAVPMMYESEGLLRDLQRPDIQDELDEYVEELKRLRPLLAPFEYTTAQPGSAREADVDTEDGAS